MTIRPQKPRLEISADWLYSRVQQLSVYEYYVHGIQIGKKMKSPIRNDRREGSWSITEKDGVVIWTDWAEDTHGNCITLVQKMFQMKFHDAIRKIATDMGILSADGEDTSMPIIRNSDRVPATRKSSLIQVTAARWSDRTLGYWQQFGITREQLDRENIHPIREWYLNRVKQPIYSDELCYAYRYPGTVPEEDKFKIYYPDRQKGSDKWFSNISTRIVESLDRLNGHEKVVVCKSKKDRCTLESLLPDSIGLISVQNESISAWNDELLQILQGRQVWISYDSDSPGKQASRRVNEKYPWMRHVNVPDNYSPYKDWAEMYAAGMKEQIVEHFHTKQII